MREKIRRDRSSVSVVCICHIDQKNIAIVAVRPNRDDFLSHEEKYARLGDV
jgi:hypothetical protein